MIGKRTAVTRANAREFLSVIEAGVRSNANRRARRRAAAVLCQVQRQGIKVSDLRGVALTPLARALRPAVENTKHTWREAIARAAVSIASMLGLRR